MDEAQRTSPRFGELPKELQIQIWSEAATTPGQFDIRSFNGGLEFWKSEQYSPCYISAVIFHISVVLDMWSCP